MQLVEHTCPTPAENLALDEALLDVSEEAGRPAEWLRVWEPMQRFVVVGRSSELEEEVNLSACHERQIPILRRVSGGAAVITGPGCLMYSVVLSYERLPGLRDIGRAHAYVLERIAAALSGCIAGVRRAGTSDLALFDRKFSGNSLRCKREHLLYHGTLLYDFPLELIGTCLSKPPRQPEYRAGRSHVDFVCNLPLSRNRLRAALLEAWDGAPAVSALPLVRMRELVASRYKLGSWTVRR